MTIPNINTSNNIGEWVAITNQLITQSNSQNTQFITINTKIANNETQIANNTLNQANNKLHVANLYIRTSNNETQIANVISRYHNANNILNGVFYSGQFPNGLKALYSLTPSANSLVFYTGSNTASTTAITNFGKSLLDDPSASTARSTLGLGTIAVNNTTQFVSNNKVMNAIKNITPVSNTFFVMFSNTSYATTRTVTPFGQVLLTTIDAADTRTKIGLGTAAQNNATQFATKTNALTSLGGVSVSADQLPYFTGASSAGTTTITNFARSLLDDTTASAGRSTLGLGTVATYNIGNSGTTIPLCSYSPTWSGNHTFNAITYFNQATYYETINSRIRGSYPSGFPTLFIECEAFLEGGMQNTLRIWVDGGDIKNRSGIYGTLSDIRLKEVSENPVSSQLDDVKFLADNMIKYRFKRKDKVTRKKDDRPYLLGWSAQDVQKRCPGLVDEDEDGYLSIKSSIIFTKSVKALGEAITKIEEQEKIINHQQKLIDDISNRLKKLEETKTPKQTQKNRLTSRKK